MKVEAAKVIEEIIDLRIRKAFSSVSIVNYLKNTYGIESSRAYDLIREARIKMGEVYKEVNTDPIKDSILLMENMLADALANGEKKLALEIQKELNKVNQLYVERKEISLSGNFDIRNLFGFDEDKKDDDVNDQTEPEV